VTAATGTGLGPPVTLLGARVRFTSRADGDLRSALPTTSARLAALAGRPVSCVRQVHGAGVVVVDDAPVQGEEGDALVTTSTSAALAVFTADCAPVALASPEGVVAAVHAGWAGLLAGVVGAAAAAMRALGASRIEAALGPCIRPGCYEFGQADLDRVASSLGPSVRATTAAGAPALDLAAAVGVALHRAGADLVSDEGVCTACAADRLFSHRARGEAGRQAMIVWRAAC
jgi:YfiH family protein